MAYTRTHTEAAPPVAGTKGRAWCSTTAVPRLSQSRKLESLEDSVFKQQQSEHLLKLWDLNGPAWLWRGGTLSRGYFPARAT